MITFQCGGCGRAFSVPDEFAGRKARCKTCGNQVVVPHPDAAVAPPPPAAPKLSMRQRRLMADAQQMTDAFRKSDRIRVKPAAGEPPEVYHVEYRVRSLDRGPDGEPVPRDAHVVEIQLTSDYPRLSPKCKMLTPIFHPNIDPATICVGDHWTAGERLADLVVRIGEMLAYQAYNIKSPLDAEAAMWADLNVKRLPTDPRSMRPAELE
jgi:ubiquitin-protein ligase/DNA-directed RNA polymerase subunit RPC12/RpoP